MLEIITDTKMKPLVSVVIPYYNAGRYIGEAVEGVLSQTYLEIGDLEVIIINDGSEDNDRKIVEEIYDGHKDDHNLILHHVRNGGKNKAIEASKPYIDQERSRYTLVHDADDVLNPVYIKRLLKHLESEHEKDSKVIMAYCDDVLMSEKGICFAQGIASEFSRESYFSPEPGEECNYIPGNAIVFTRVFLNAVPEDLITSNQDKRIRHMAELGENGSAAHLKEKLFFYRQRPDSLSGHWEQLLEDLGSDEYEINRKAELHYKRLLELPLEEQFKIIAELSEVWNSKYWQNYRARSGVNS